MQKKKKLLLAGDIQSIHFQKWVLALKDDFDLSIFSLSFMDNEEFVNQFGNIEKCISTSYFDVTNAKRFYLVGLFRFNKFVKKIKPDILHGHYVSQYGVLLSFINHDKKINSVWGSDVYKFPYKSFIHRLLVRRALRKSDSICSTSLDLKKATQSLTSKNIEIVSFGIDTNLFKKEEISPKNKIVIGTVKGLKHVYGIDRLIHAMSVISQSYDDVECHIYGEGEQYGELKQLVTDLHLENVVFFKGFVSNKFVPNVLNSFDIYCALSRSESFGVAVLEASSCEVPVVVSNVGGLPEVVLHEKTGFIVDPTNENIVTALKALINDKFLRSFLGLNGRKLVEENYSWNNSILKMKEIYNRF